MQGLLLSVLIAIVLWGISVATMVFGWGLQPVSWSWIIGGFVATVLLGACSVLMK